MARSRIPMPNRDSIGPLCCPDGTNVIFVSDDDGANKRYPDFCNRGVHCNPDGTTTPFKVKGWNTYDDR